MPTFRRRHDRTHRVFYGWYVVAASFAILFLTGSGSSMIGVMIKPMGADFGWSRTSISSAIFVNMAVYAVSIIVTGRLYDRFGPKWVIACSTVLFAAGFALMATMDSLWQFLLYYGVIAAAGLGGTTVPLFGSLMGRWFDRWKGLAASLALAGNCLGQFLLIPVFSDLIDGSGWRVTSLWIAGLCGVVGLVLTFTVIRGDPGQLGLKPFGADGSERRAEEPARMAASAVEPRRAEAAAGVSIESGAASAAPAAAAGPRDLTLLEAMRTRALWLYAFVMFVCGSGDYFVSTHLVPMVTDYGISTSVAASMFAWLSLISLAGILVAGPASDAIGYKIPIAVTFALRVVVFAILLKYQGIVPFWVFSVSFGFTLLVTAPLTPMLVRTLYGVTHIGFISGFITTVHMVGGGLWAYLAGIIFDNTGDYRLAFWISLGFAAAATVAMLLIREERHLPRGGPAA